MRNRLIEILRTPIFPHELADPTEAVADYLLDNDVMPIVRCKDCKQCDISHPTGKPTPRYLCKRNRWTVTRADDFCSYGERRTE